MNFLRNCGGCSGHILTNDPASQTVYCRRCQSVHVQPFDAWSAGIRVGSTVYVQPYAAWRGLSGSRYLVIDRDGDELTIQVLGIPESRMKTHINHTAQHDVTPRALGGAL